MIPTKIDFITLFITSLILCCLHGSVFGSRLSVIDNKTDAIESIETDVLQTKSLTENKTNIKNEFSMDEMMGVEDGDDEQTAEKTAIQPSDETSLSVWGIVNRLWNWINEDVNGNLFGYEAGETPAVAEGRTFGKIRRLQMALIPIVFKFGVLSAMVAFLVALGVKTLFLVKVLVVMNLLALLAKFFTLKSNFAHVEHFSAPPAPMWSPYLTPGWHSTPEEHHVNKEIHLHIHGNQLQPHASSYSYGSGTTGQTHGWEKRSDPYVAYKNIGLQRQQNELIVNELPTTVNSPVSNGQAYGRSFPDNHRMF